MGEVYRDPGMADHRPTAKRRPAASYIASATAPPRSAPVAGGRAENAHGHRVAHRSSGGPIVRYRLGTCNCEEGSPDSVTTYLFIGLILLLAAYLVNARRGRGDGSAGATLRRPRASRAPAMPPPPIPAAVAVAESAAAHAPARVDAVRPGPIAEPPMSWSPEETIVEPGWPLPGEISGGWSTAPSSGSPTFSEPDPPPPVVEWQPMAAAPPEGADAPVAGAELPVAGEWAMPAVDAADSAGSSPPMWIPEPAVTAPAAEDAVRDEAGAIDPSAIWLAEPAATSAPVDAGIAAWQPETADVPDAPPLEWTDPPAAPEAAGADAGPSELAWAAGPSIAPEPEPPASVWEASAPGLEDTTGIADPGPAEPVAGETPDDAPASVPEWIAAAAPEHAAFAAAIFEEPVAPAAEEPLPGPGASEAPAGDGPAETIPPVAWPEAPSPVSHELAPAPAPLAGLVPLTGVCDHLGVTPRMLALMRILADTPMSVSELARSLSVSRPLVADLCARVQSAGLAEREPDDADRRRVRVVLTEAGHLLCAETAASPETGSYEDVLGRLSPAERAQLRLALQEMEQASP